MNNPSIDELMKKVDSRYSLVVSAAKRAREITASHAEGSEPEAKPVSEALREIASGKINYERAKGGIK